MNSRPSKPLSVKHDSALPVENTQFIVLNGPHLRHRFRRVKKRKVAKKPAKNQSPAINELIQIMARLRSPTGCPWDREQDHRTLRFHAVEEVYELIDAIEAGDDHEMLEELGDLLLQVVFHCQLARERGAFDFDAVARNISEKLIRRHPHVFGEGDAKTVDEVWAQWDKIKKAEKAGTKNERPSALDGIPRHLPALMYAEKLVKKARKAKLADPNKNAANTTKEQIAQQLFALAATAQGQGWSAEDLLRAEIKKRERAWREREERE
jgi:XTP/dITP diphosphohydrolase